MEDKRSKQLKDFFSSIAPIGVLTWALGVLTASYFGVAKNIDSAFISSLVTTVLASYGISRTLKDKEDSPSVKKTKEKIIQIKPTERGR